MTIDGARPVAEVGGRRNGRSATHRLAAERAALAGEHVHVAGRVGSWCVTAQPVGFLWARLASPRALPSQTRNLLGRLASIGSGHIDYQEGPKP